MSDAIQHNQPGAGSVSGRDFVPGQSRAGRLFSAVLLVYLAEPLGNLVVGGHGGREIGLVLGRAARIFAHGSAPVRHAILVVSGRDEGLHPSRLAMTARACAGLYTADCLGLGDDWDVAEMRLVSEQLSGTVALVAEPESLPEAVRAGTRGAAAKRSLLYI